MVALVPLPGFEAGALLASRLEAALLRVSEKAFPDGELYVRIEDYDKLSGEDVVVASTLYPEQLEKLFKTLILINAAKSNGAKRVVAYVAYLAYARQDKVFLPGEPVSACVVSKALRTSGADALVVVDAHSPRALECFEGPVANVAVSHVLVGAALKYLEDPVVIAPDKGALERAEYAAKHYGLDYDYLIKQRDRVTGEVSYVPREVSVKNRDVVIVDDIISTGGTIAEASRVLLRSGARRIAVAASHGLLVGEALRKLESSGVAKVVLGNTLMTRHEHPLVEYVDVTPVVAEELKRLLKPS